MKGADQTTDGADVATILVRVPDGSERRPGFRPAALAAGRIVRPIVEQHGGGVLARLKSDWAAIAGPDLAAATWPEALARGGTLKLRVAPVQALAIQHRSHRVIERINLFFGRAVVERLALIQGPLPLPPPPPPPSARPLAQGEETALDRQLDGISDPELRAALDRLGRSVIAASEP